MTAEEAIRHCEAYLPETDIKRYVIGCICQNKYYMQGFDEGFEEGVKKTCKAIMNECTESSITITNDVHVVRLKDIYDTVFAISGSQIGDPKYEKGEKAQA